MTSTEFDQWWIQIELNQAYFQRKKLDAEKHKCHKQTHDHKSIVQVCK